eukprot:2395047-Rhodomonas_salina.1
MHGRMTGEGRTKMEAHPSKREGGRERGREKGRERGKRRGRVSDIVLRRDYAMSGTYIAYAATYVFALCDVRYSPSICCYQEAGGG